MNEPIHAGCLAEVVGGLLGDKSPNLGLIVRVKQYLGDEKTYGRIWRCETEYAQTLKLHDKPTPPGTADFAQSWLRKLPPDQLPGQAEKADKQVTA